MNQFTGIPQTLEQPKYSAEQLERYLEETNGALAVSVKVLVRGMETSADAETYKPWPKAQVQTSLASILSFFESKVGYYEGAGQAQKAQEAREKVERLRKVFSEIDNNEEVPEGFLQRVQQAVEAEMAA